MFLETWCDGVLKEYPLKTDFLLIRMPGYGWPVVSNPDFIWTPDGEPAGMPAFVEGSLEDGRFVFNADTFPENPELKSIDASLSDYPVVDDKRRETVCHEFGLACKSDNLRNWHLRRMLAERFGCRISEIPKEKIAELAGRIAKLRESEIETALSRMRKPGMQAMNKAKKDYYLDIVKRPPVLKTSTPANHVENDDGVPLADIDQAYHDLETAAIDLPELRPIVPILLKNAQTISSILAILKILAERVNALQSPVNFEEITRIRQQAEKLRKRGKCANDEICDLKG